MCEISKKCTTYRTRFIENENATAWTHQIWCSQLLKAIFIIIKDCGPWTVVSSKYMNTDQINDWINIGSRVDQRWINDPSTIIYNKLRIQVFMIVLLALLNGMSERGWNCMDTSNLTFRNSQSNFIKYCDLASIFSAEYEGTDYINDGSTMDQRCIVGTSIAYTRSSWWFLARTRTTTPEKRETEPNKQKQINEKKSQKQRDKGQTLPFWETPLFGKN